MSTFHRQNVNKIVENGAVPLASFVTDIEQVIEPEITLLQHTYMADPLT